MIESHTIKIDTRSIGEQHQNECEFGDDVNRRVVDVDISQVVGPDSAGFVAGQAVVLNQPLDVAVVREPFFADVGSNVAIAPTVAAGV